MNQKKLCDYGCGKEANHYFSTVNKWCCSKTYNTCPNKRKEQSKTMNQPEVKEKHKKAIKEAMNQPEIKKKNRKAMKEVHNRPEVKEKHRKAMKLSIEQIQERYPIFSKEEEMRYNPDKPGEKEIQVHCKYSECKNSKENGGWFTLTFQQYQSRKDALEKDDGNDGRYLYCSEECKQECCLYYFRSDPLRLNEFEKYYKTVGGKTNLTFKKFYNEIENAGSRGKKYGYELDHKFSIYDGFINNVDPEIIAHYKNLECISELENQKKNKTSSITLEELMKMITNSKRKVK